MPDVHALLSASSSKRWINCPPSVRLEEGFPNESSVYAKEGTFAHSLCEFKVRKYLHERVIRPQSDEFYSEEIDLITDMYFEFVVGVIEEMKKNGSAPLVLVEERVDYSHIAPLGFGTADLVVIGKDESGRGILHVIDFKAGKGIYVDPDHNSQMMLYAIGALNAYGYIYPIEDVRMTIVQPRLDNISTFECSRQELEEWGESIKEVAKMAFEGKGDQNPGDWCRFCRAKPVCRACAEEAMSLASEEFLDLNTNELSAEIRDSSVAVTDQPAQIKEEAATPVFKQPGLIPLSDLAGILPTLNRIYSWIESVFAFVTSEAISHGVSVPGYKVVEGRSKRIFTDPRAVVDIAVQNGYTDLYKQQLITLTEFEKMMGKKRFNELLGEYVTKPPGKLTLVPEDDPRPPVDIMGNPEQDFTILPVPEET